MIPAKYGLCPFTIHYFDYYFRPLGNMAITVSALAVVAVSTERFLAIVRPLQYKVLNRNDSVP